MDEAPSTLVLSLSFLSRSLPPSLLSHSFSLSLSITSSSRHLLSSSVLLPSLHPHFKLQCFPLPLSLSLFRHPSPICLADAWWALPFKARQMERQALSPSSSPNDLFLTMGPNGTQIINDEGSMERWATQRVREGESFHCFLAFSASAFQDSQFSAFIHQLPRF